jgi:isoaspartyl peptidase/L-asparaginase-like protein (Ntn-hydrolase superfamily)
MAGDVEMDASIMEGRELMAGAVASGKAVRNPISAARRVMDRSRHVMLVGPDADRFVSDGSQFTTGASENPTLTIVTLVVRQADYIADQMAQGNR